LWLVVVVVLGVAAVDPALVAAVARQQDAILIWLCIKYGCHHPLPHLGRQQFIHNGRITKFSLADEAEAILPSILPNIQAARMGQCEQAESG